MRAKLATLMIVSSALLVSACGSKVDVGSSQERAVLHSSVESAIRNFTTTDPGLRQQIDSSHAYAIFPEIVTGAVGVGGAHGNGEVYQAGRFVGWADMSQASIGVQLGGQKYAELILFRDPSTYTNFTSGTFEFQAGASAVVASAGAASTADYTKGVAIFTLPLGGAMFQAAVGGQKFRFTPAAEGQMAHQPVPGTPTESPGPGTPAPR